VTKKKKRLDGETTAKEFDDFDTARKFALKVERTNHQLTPSGIHGVLHDTGADIPYEIKNASGPKTKRFQVFYSFANFLHNLGGVKEQDLIDAQYAIQSRLDEQAKELGGRDF